MAKSKKAPSQLNRFALRDIVNDFIILTQGPTKTKREPYETRVFKDFPQGALVYVEPHTDKDSALMRHQQITEDVSLNPKKYAPGNLD